MGTIVPDILIVADKAPARQSLADALVPGVILRQAASAAEALSLLLEESASVDLAVIDMNLPESAAVTLTRKLRDAQSVGHRRNLPIVVVVENAATPAFKAVQRMGIQGHVAWPLNPQALHTLVHRLLPQAAVVVDVKPEVAAPAAVVPKKVEVASQAERLVPSTPPSLDDPGVLVSGPRASIPAPVRRKWRLSPAPAAVTAIA